MDLKSEKVRQFTFGMRANKQVSKALRYLLEEKSVGMLIDLTLGWILIAKHVRILIDCLSYHHRFAWIHIIIYIFKEWSALLDVLCGLTICIIVSLLLVVV